MKTFFRNEIDKMSQSNSENVSRIVVKKCLHMFDKLPKRGKPSDHQWTVLSAIVLVNTVNPDQIKVVSYATGTKCLDGSTRLKSSPGTLIHDSHAEILARRGFILWLLHEIKLSKKTGST